MPSLKISKALLLATMDDRGTEYEQGYLTAVDGVIQEVGSGTPPGGAADLEIDATGMVVLPGLVNTHHHLFQTLTRNVPRMQDRPLFDWLRGHYEIWRELTPEAVDLSTRIGLLELMKSGVGTSADHLYVFPEAAGAELIDAEIEAAREVGLRFHPTRGSMSLGRSEGGLPPDDVVQSEEDIQRDTERLLAKYHDDAPGSMTRLALAPCSPFSVTPTLMKATAEYARINALGLHTHLAETLDEERYCVERYGLRPVSYVEQLGWMTYSAWFAHGVHLDGSEIARLAEVGAGVAHCPTSNMRLGSGIAPVRELLRAGVKVGLGVDGSASNDSSNLLLEARNALLLSRLREESCWLGARDVLRMATRGGASLLGRSDIGSLEAGQRADLAAFSLAGTEYAGALSDPLAALVFCARAKPVDYLVVEGRALIREGRSGVNEQALVEDHNWRSGEMIRRAARRTGIDFLRR